MTQAIEFKDFGKIARFRTIQVTVTEKIDGTNAQVYVPEDPAAPVLAGSRNKWVTADEPGGGNFGFGRWVAENAELLRRLGPGRHFGEWYGAGIGRRYGLAGKRLALFNVDRFSGGLPEGLAEIGVELVPVLYRGAFDSVAISDAVEKLYRGGSVLVPGFDKPEGVIVLCGGQRWKITDNGDQHKGCTTDHGEVVKAAAAADRAKREASQDPFDVAMRTITVTRLGDVEGCRPGFSVAGKSKHGVPYSLLCEQEEIPAKRRELAAIIVKANEQADALRASPSTVDHTIKATAHDLRSALAEKIRKEHPKLCEGKSVEIAFSGEGNNIVATVTFKYAASSSGWD